MLEILLVGNIVKQLPLLYIKVVLLFQIVGGTLQFLFLFPHKFSSEVSLVFQDSG